MDGTVWPTAARPSPAHPLTEVFILPDGRRLAYAVYGDPAGHPTFYFHGFPGSRVEATLAADVATRARVRLIAIDRPGMGGSDFQAGRRLLDWPADVVRLADHLRLQRFSVVGVSGGAPYAAVCARALAGRADAVALVSGVAPLEDRAMLDGMLRKNALLVRVAQRAPHLLRNLLRPAVLLRVLPRGAIRALAAVLDEADRRVLRRGEVVATLAASLTVSLRQGTRGHAHELLILSQPWGFSLGEVQVPVAVWHGGRDPVVPPSHFRWYVQQLPGCRQELLPQEGHFSLVIDHTAAIFARLQALRG
jgi:pimeloyl-ACP methyl ester carboxylesterase